MPVLRLVRGFAAAVVLCLSVLPLSIVAAHAAGKPVTVFAAASLKTALDAIVKGYDAGAGHTVVVSYAASSALAKQIEQGAPADIFISADLDWMDDVAKHDLIKAGTRANLLGNRIVLIAPADEAAPADPLASPATLAGALGGGRLAMGDVAAVPAGKYGKAALETLGLWDGIKDHIAQAENVRAALALVARGEAALGIVYQTDAAAEPGVKIVARFPTSSHPPIVYPAALMANAPNPDAAAFLAHLRTPEAIAAFEKEGFTVLP